MQKVHEVGETIFHWGWSVRSYRDVDGEINGDEG